MTAEMVLKLLEAGYSKSEIGMMEELEPKQISAAAPAEALPAEEPQTAEQTEEPQQAEQANDQNANNALNALNALTETVNALAKTVEALQKKNAQQAESDPPKKFTTADALQDFFGGRKKA